MMFWAEVDCAVVETAMNTGPIPVATRSSLVVVVILRKFLLHVNCLEGPRGSPGGSQTF
jgi:hypothetical protein